MSSNDENKLKLFDKFVDILVDLYDPLEDEEEETRDDMLQVVTMIFESVELEVIDSDTDDRQLFSVKL
tara:strand:- start:2223 stop:2426 length:204 start_codon:yes stop_codon:yes gene_type:complete